MAVSYDIVTCMIGYAKSIGEESADKHLRDICEGNAELINVVFLVVSGPQENRTQILHPSQCSKVISIFP